MALTIFKSTDQSFNLMQQQWSQMINPILGNVITSGQPLKQISLVSGANVINHGLGQKLQGYFLVRKRQWLSSGTPTVYDITDTQDTNSMPSLTLNLYCTQGTASNPVVVDLWVF